MLAIQGCPISAALFDAWTQLLVCEAAPFFLTEPLASRLPGETTVLSRAEFKQLDLALSYHDSYRTYAVRPEGSAIACLSPQEFDSMPPSIQAELLYAQWHLGRGQVYDWDAIYPLLRDNGVLSSAMSRVVETFDGRKFILDWGLWTSLSATVQRQWLTQFVQEQQESYDILDHSVVSWDNVIPDQRTSIQAFSNRFPSRSGPNCFATTLAAVTLRLPTALTIGNSWLHQAPFLRGLAARGYHQHPGVHVETSHLEDAIFVWFDSRGTPQHSCYVLGEGIALNKNSQAWYTPHHLVALPDLIKCWSDEPFDIMVYQCHN